MNLTEAILARRTVRAYEPRIVDERTISGLIELAVHAPSAMNAQPWGFAIIQDRERLRAYSERAKVLLLEGMARDEKTAAYAELLRADSYNLFYDAGTLIVVCATSVGRYSEADCWLAAQTLMLAACDVGLGTCPIGFAIPFLNTVEMKRELAIPEEGAAVAPIIVGYPSGPTPAVPRWFPRIFSWRVPYGKRDGSASER